MRVTIATSGRFHVADLARELIRHGHDVQFHSIVPPPRLEAFGIPRQHQHCHLGAVAPLVAAQRQLRLSRPLAHRLDGWISRRLDHCFAEIQEPGEVFIGMSGICLSSLRAAKARGAHVVLERGSMHILEQKRILDAIDGPEARCSQVSDLTVARELEGYALADTIAIPARHVEASFLAHGVPAEKLFRNPYGVDLSAFRPNLSVQPRFDVITTGTWCLRKGSDLLAQVVLDQLGLSLLHVGVVGDVALPSHPGFQHHPGVLQQDLPQFYSQARIFALPSREDGFGMVFTQALACGLPIVGSTTSGAPEIGEWLGLTAPLVLAVPAESTAELAVAVQTALAWARANPIASRPPVDLSSISWQAYGDRYASYLVGAIDHA